jgi:uncharacterized membrane protein YhfC
MDYLIYFLGPLILGVVGATILRQRFRIFFIGFVAFLIAWIVMQTLAGIATKGLHVAETSFLYGLIVSALAGIFEESTRYVVFRQFDSFKGNRNWNSSMMSALGHHGMETVIVGLTMLLIFVVVKYKPDAISDPATLKQCREMVALGAGVKIYNALERLVVGFFIHASFSGVVMFSFARSRVRWLFIAMAWHFAHNLIGFNLHRLSSHWLVSKGWIVIVIALCSYVLFRLRRAMPPAPVVSTADLPPMVPPVA